MQDVSRGEGRTVLFVSHNMAAVRSLCKSSIVLSNGQISFSGNVDQGINLYAGQSQFYSERYSIKNALREHKCTKFFSFERIQFLDKEQNIIEEPRCGQYTIIKIYINAQKSLSNCNISLGIRDIFGNPMCSFASNYTCAPFNFNEGIQSVDLIIPRFPLTQGRYNVTLWGESNFECADYIENSIFINVEDDDFFGKGKNISQHLKGKVVLCDHSWNFE